MASVNVKSNRDWFKYLSEEDEKDAIRCSHIPDIMSNTLQEAIMRGFAWANTHKGAEYWDGLYNKARLGQIIPRGESTLNT